jgi:hypothetical protein
VRALGASIVALVAFLVLAAPAAAAIGNDDRETATVIDPIPLWDTVDTSTATTSTLEQSFSGGQLFYGVWYRYPAPSVDTLLTFVLANVVEGDGALSNPYVAFILDDGSGWSGPVGTDTNLQGEVPAGRDAYIVVGNGSPGHPGLIQLGVFGADPIDHFGLTLNANGSVDKLGTMNVAGIVSCDYSAQAYLSVYVKQKTGHGFIYGETTFQVADCVAPASPWSLQVSPSAGGKFVAGSASVSAEIICPYASACAPTFTQRTVKLKLVK